MWLINWENYRLRNAINQEDESELVSLAAKRLLFPLPLLPLALGVVILDDLVVEVEQGLWRICAIGIGGVRETRENRGVI